MSIEETLKGAADLQKKLKCIENCIKRQRLQAMKIEAELIMTKSKQEYAPRDKGTLVQSGVVGDPVEVGDDVQVTMGYGGAAAPYATALHEHPSESSPPTWEGKELTFTVPGTGVKYLERPLMEAVDGLAARVAARIDISKCNC